VHLQGCIELLKRSGVEMKGKTAAVVGRSNIVGLPVALLLQNEDATVTMVHSRTPNAGEQRWHSWACLIGLIYAVSRHAALG
jgi:5,10-methylene-tetrahydrofolate dehydrogenase/methenyl tetrahydrofolate cyclohydrolase